MLRLVETWEDICEKRAYGALFGHSVAGTIWVGLGEAWSDEDSPLGS